MLFELSISPAGRISLQAGDSAPAKLAKQSTRTPKRTTQRTPKRTTQRKTPTSIKRLEEAFQRSNAAGLFELVAFEAARKATEPMSPSGRYWTGFASRYLDRVSSTIGVTDDFNETHPITDADLAELVLSLPPMRGAEYVSRDVLAELWMEFEAWIRYELQEKKQTLTEFFQERVPSWHQVGRVCLHLAENRRDPDFPFAFLATYAPSTSPKGTKKTQYQPLSKALQQYAGAKNKRALVKLLSPIQSATQSSEFLHELVDSGDIYAPLAWSPAEAYQFLNDVPIMEQNGIRVRLPDWWKKRPRPRVGVTIGDTKQTKFDASSMLDFRVQVALGDESLTENEIQSLLDGDDGLRLIKGQWVEVDRERLQQALEHWKAVEEDAVDGLSFSDGMRLLAGAPVDLRDELPTSEEQDWSFVDAGDWLGKLIDELRSPQRLETTHPGKELKATLRDYQATGVSWLAFLSSLGLGACLADDMGLGKTIQVISLLLIQKKRKSAGPSLLVLPASLLGNWKSEIEKFAPTIAMRFVHGSQATKEEIAAMADNPKRELKEVDVVLTTYGTLLRQPWLLEQSWQLVVLDEAQAIKNPSSRQTKCVKQLRAKARIALTGTPVENRLGDLWSLFDFLCPGLLGTATKFQKFIKALEQRSQDQYAPLRRLVSPYILRRLKTDKRVISDLPEKTEVTAYCGLAKRQAATYQKLVKELAKALKDQEGIKRRGLVLSYLMRLKQVCNHPAQMLGTGDFDRKDSGKFSRLVQICEEISSRQEKVLVFTQFRELTKPLSHLLADVFGRDGFVLHGGTAVKRRQKLVDEFQSDDGPPFFVLSLKAAGTGLNLTAASHVIHFDRWWNPAVENQATDRAFRIGQKRNVLVHKFVCQGTIEERIDELIGEKKQLAANVLEGGGEKMLTELSDSELIKMVSLDVERVNF